MVRLVLTDLDDTLIASGSNGISDRAVAAMRAARDAGILVGPSTGRPRAALPWMFRNNADLYETGVFVNGMQGWARGSELFAHRLKGEDLRELALFLDGTDMGVLTVFDDETDDRSMVTTRPRKAPWPPLPWRGPDRWMHPDDLPDEVLKANVWIERPMDRLHETIAELNEAFDTMDLVSPSPTLSAADLLPAGWSKAKGAQELARTLGVAEDEVLVLGDSENDLAMIEAFPMSVAMGNAVGSVKAAARWVIGDTRDDAVAALLERLAASPDADDLDAVVLG